MVGFLRRRGANAVEFALTIPVMIGLLAGTLEYGYLFYLRSAVISAVGDGCRVGSLVDPGYAEGEAAAVIRAAQDAIVAELESFGAAPCDDGCVATASLIDTSPARSLQCELRWRVRPIVGLLVSEDVDLYATNTARLEWQR